MERQSGFDRRTFLKNVALGAAGTGVVGSVAAAVTEPSVARADIDEAAGSTSDGETPMTLEELNAFRQQLVDAQTDYTCADGTVIPAVYVKLRALVNSYSFGIGSEVNDHAFDEFVYLFTEDEAQAYLEMPYGVQFSAADFALKSGATRTSASRCARTWRRAPCCSASVAAASPTSTRSAWHMGCGSGAAAATTPSSGPRRTTQCGAPTRLTTRWEPFRRSTTRFPRRTT